MRSMLSRINPRLDAAVCSCSCLAALHSSKGLHTTVLLNPFRHLHTDVLLNPFRHLHTDVLLKPETPALITDKSTASVYVHWPYCQRRCTYCNFNKYISKQVDHQRMRKCLQKEAATLLKKSSVQTVTSVFFGGGTPSLSEPQTLGAVLETISREVHLVENAEVTIEINPTAMETSQMRNFQRAGINRASIGVQTLNDSALRCLGRDHNSTDSLRCLERTSKIFDGRTSVDLMFGYPGQSLHMWTAELTQMVSLCDEHISLYQLTFERGTQLFKDVTSGNVIMPSGDEIADMYLAAVEILRSHGFVQYEVSNFAKGENYCWHNIGYWTGQQYVGVGPGSHGRVWHNDQHGCYRRHACVQTLEPDHWMREVERKGHATRKTVTQSTTHILEELVTVGMRTAWGLLDKNWSALIPLVRLDELVESPRTAQWIKEGFLRKTSHGVQATESGLAILDSILPDVLLDIETLMATHCLDGQT